MALLFIDELFSGRHLHALCWMLVHSVWQGLLLAVIAGMLVSLTRKSPAALRYNLLLGSLAAFAAGAVITYCWYLGDYLPEIVDSQLTENSLGELLLAKEALPVTERLWGSTVLFFNEYSSVIVLVWLIICLIRLGKIVRNMRQLHTLRHSQLISPDKIWTEKAIQFARALGITRSAGLMESALVKVPMVIGHLKPLILLPAGMLCSLPPAEIEAILLHELAHIRRRDYLVNILQHGIELVFFFNLPMIWVSSLIRAERENCCDDIASGFTGDRRTYINALVGFYEKQVTSSAAVAWTGSRHELFERVKRLIHNRNKNLNIMEKLFLSAGIVAAGLLLYAFNTNTPSLNGKPAVEAATQLSPFHLLLTDTIGKGKQVINATSDEGKKYRVVMENGAIKELYVDDVAVPEDQRAIHMPFIDKLVKDAEEAAEDAAEARDEAEEAREQGENDKREADAARRETDASRKEMEKELREAERAADKARAEADKARREADRLRQRLGRDNESAAIDKEEIREAIEEAQREIRNAMKDAKLSAEDKREIQEEIRKAMQEIKNIDHEKIKADINKAFKEVEDIDMKEIQASIDDAMESLEEIHIDIDDKALSELVASAMEIAGSALKEVEISLRELEEKQEPLSKKELREERKAEKREARKRKSD